MLEIEDALQLNTGQKELKGGRNNVTAASRGDIDDCLIRPGCARHWCRVRLSVGSRVGLELLVLCAFQ